MQTLWMRLKIVFRTRAFRRVLVILVGVWLVFAVGLAIRVHQYGALDQAQPADVIIVLGAGLDPHDRPTRSLALRSLHAADLWQGGLAPSVICTGGITGRASRSEASACGDILRERGLPQQAIILEEHSRSTEENALFTQAIMRERGWQTAILVSDPYHMLRAAWLFDNAGILTYPSAVTANYLTPIEYNIKLAREVAALHWQAVKELFHLPITHLPLV